MFKNRTESGSRNVSGERITYFRKNLQEKTSQRAFAEMLQLSGLEIDKNTIQRIESGHRFVTDIEIKMIAQALEISYDELLD
ncbi:MAG: helix-turn-helix domain-containing protein [Turicibacter sp.]|nr:helix-turn-helix domain-containing protein [Turicibacter sp.]